MSYNFGNQIVIRLNKLQLFTKAIQQSATIGLSGAIKGKIFRKIAYIFCIFAT